MAITSAPLSSRAWAESPSTTGSNQVLVQTTSTWASGLVSSTPRVKALIPLITSGIGNAATYPMRFEEVAEPATMPDR